MCMAIPSWEWIRESNWFENLLFRRYADCEWLDKRMCNSLLPRSSHTSAIIKLKAFHYYEEQLGLAGVMSDVEPVETSKFDETMSCIYLIRFDYDEILCEPAFNDYEIEWGDAVLYFVNTMRSVAKEIKDILAKMKDYQSLILAVKRDINQKNSSKLACLVKCIEDLGGLDNSPLKNTSVCWYFWCLSVEDNKYLNLLNMLSYVSYKYWDPE